MRTCARCDVRVADFKDPFFDADDMVAIKEGEAEEIAAYADAGEPLCPDCADKLSTQPTEDL